MPEPTHQKRFAIIVAGGKGIRLGDETPKQFLPLNGIPVLMHTIHAFQKCEHKPQIIVCIHPSMQPYWFDLCYRLQFHVPHLVADGGDSRTQSVKNGLNHIKTTETDWRNSLIAVHDGARPLIKTDLIDLSYENASRYGATALAIQSTDSVRIKDEGSDLNKAIDRQRVFFMQTPQTFKGSILIEAYERLNQETHSDDATLVEKQGNSIHLMAGDPDNIKITYPKDLRIAELLINKK